MLDIEKTVGAKLDVGSWSLATFARLFIASVLPNDIDRIIYLDCDTMVRGSLLSLWNEDLEGDVIGGVLNEIPKQLKMAIFRKPESLHINAGILLINLKKWRNLNVESKLISFMKIFGEKVPIVDEGVINGVLGNYIQSLHPKYNYMPAFNIFTRKQIINRTGIINFYSDNILNSAKDNPTIFHYISNTNRPWIKGNTPPFKDEYIKYRNMTPWANFPLREPKPETGGVFKKTVRKIWKILPKSIYEKYKKFRTYIRHKKIIAYSKKRLRESNIKLEDCYINYDKTCK